MVDVANPAREQPFDSLRMLATRAYEEADGDRSLANRLLLELLKTHPMGEALIEKALSAAAANAIAGVIAYRRRRIIYVGPSDSNASDFDNALRGDRVIVLAAARLSEFPLPSGKTLGAACHWEIEHAVQIFRSRADTLAFRADWLAEIASRMPPNKRVLEVLTEADLERLAYAALHGGGQEDQVSPPLLSAAE